MFCKILGIFADILAVFALWGIDGDSPVCLKIICTITFVLFALKVSVKESYPAKVSDYCWPVGEKPTLFINKNSNFKDNALVSIYIKEDNNIKLAAIGFVINENGDKYVQIKVFRYISDSNMCKINFNKKSYKKFFVKPDVRYSDISGIDFREIEEVDGNV